MKATTAASLTAFVALAASASARTFTVKNNCAYTIWPALFTDLNAGSAVPDQTTGWEAAAGSEVSFSVPDNWTAGRIWGRRDCDFSTNPGPTSCVTGGCNGGLVCDTSTGTGVPPVTLAEFTLSSSDTPDNYDVSVVDGFNVPIDVTNTASCPEASCPADLNPNCPSELQLLDSSGNIAGCKSACEAGLAADPANSENCCTGSHNTPDTCPPSGVADYSYFKDSCPNSYVYAYDESSGTALFTCPSASKADYTITFCP